MTTGDRIRHYRLKLGWTLEHLAEISGVKTGTISALEQRSSSKSDYFAPIARAFGLSVEQLADTATDWDVAATAAGIESPSFLRMDSLDAKTPPKIEEPTPTYGVPRGYSRQALDLAREFDAIRSKKWQKTSYAYCMQIMNRDPLMMAWLDRLTKAQVHPAGAQPTHEPSSDR